MYDSTLGKVVHMRFRPKKTWLVVADGARAEIYLNKGRGKGLQPVASDESAEGRLPTREQGTGKPGRGFAPGAGRHAFSDPTDWHEQAKQSFARGVAERINRGAARKAFDELVIAAPSKTLGELRNGLSDEARRRLRADIAKDLTNLSVHELPKHLASVAEF